MPYFKGYKCGRGCGESLRVVEDENELMGVLKVFEELLEDIDIDM